jgi:hypothetical protein
MMRVQKMRTETGVIPVVAAKSGSVAASLGLAGYGTNEQGADHSSKQCEPTQLSLPKGISGPIRLVNSLAADAFRCTPLMPDVPPMFYPWPKHVGGKIAGLDAIERGETKCKGLTRG